MNLKEFIEKEIKTTINGMVSEDTQLDQAFNDAKPVEESVMSELDLLAREARDLKSFIKTVYKEFDNLPKSKDTLNWLKDTYTSATTDEGIEEAAKRDYKKEYAKYGKSEKAKKYRAELNKYNRDKGTYGNGDGKDASHKGGKIVGFEDESKNRGRAEKSRLKKESVNEADITIGGKEYNLTKSGSKITLINKKLSADKFTFRNVKAFKDWADDQVEPIGGTQSSHFGINEAKVNYDFSEDELKRVLKLLGRGASTEVKMIKAFEKAFGRKLTRDELFESLNEKLITFSNRAPYGQIVFMAGGAGSGKGFAIDNFIDSAGFKVRDVDEMKKAVGKLDQLGKFSVDKWYKKYGKKLSDKPDKGGGLSPKAHVEEFVLGKGLSISDISKDLKNPNNVASLHYIVDSMGLKDKWLISMLSGKNNKETLPNLLFDITAKKVTSITEVIKPLIANGYDSKNIHLIWVLANFHVAIQANKERDRMVPEDILLKTHEGAGQTMWEIMTKILPKGLNGRIDVILNKRAETVPYVDSNGKPIMVQPNQKNKLEDAQIVVKGFTSLPIKKQGGGVQPEKAWKEILKKWILDNAPKTINLSQNLGESVNEVKDNLYLQLHKKYAEQIKGLKAKKIKKLTDLVSVQRWSMEEREDYFGMDSKKKKELSKEYDTERKLFKKYIGGDESVMLPKGTETLSEESVEANDTYFKTAGEAVDFAKTKAEKKGYEIDEDDWNNQITHGGRYNRLRPGVGKTHSFQIGLLKKGKPQRKGLSISLYGMDSGKYELTYYIN